MPTTVAIAGQTSLNVRLKEDTQALEEVVVVGYGTLEEGEFDRFCFFKQFDEGIGEPSGH